MKSFIEFILWFSVCWWCLLFARYYYYVIVKKENPETIKEVVKNGPIFKSRN